MSAASAARAAIYASASGDRIIWLEWSAPLAAALALEATDGAENGDVLEFWGALDSGEYWRVHLDRDVDRACARFEEARRGD